MKVLPTTWRHKSTGIDVEQNYVTVTLCIVCWHSQWCYTIGLNLLSHLTKFTDWLINWLFDSVPLTQSLLATPQRLFTFFSAITARWCLQGLRHLDHWTKNLLTDWLINCLIQFYPANTRDVHKSHRSFIFFSPQLPQGYRWAGFWRVLDPGASRDLCQWVSKWVST